MGKGAEEGGSTGGIPARGEKKINESSWKVQWGGSMSSTCGRRMAEEAALRNTPKSFMGPPDCHSTTHEERKGSDHNGDDLLSDRARSPLCCTMGVAKGKQGDTKVHTCVDNVAFGGTRKDLERSLPTNGRVAPT